MRTLVFITLLTSVTYAQSEETGDKRITLAVEYVGAPDSTRGKSFVEFLEANFTKVHATDRANLRTAEDSVAAFASADVLVVDTNLSGVLPPAFSKPMVVLSGRGVQTAESLGAKLDWLCLCLRAEAHRLRTRHPIFQGPRTVDTTTVSKVDEYTGKTIDAWRVQQDLKEPGLVATRRRFVGSPDSEIIAGGINMKGDRGVALVREGNLFLWGFSGSPEQMTEPGKAALVNVIYYMKKFGGQAPSRRIGTRERSRWKNILDSKYITAKRLPTYFGPELVAAHGEDKNAYRADLNKRERFLFVRKGTSTLSIDADAEALGHATNSLDLIEAALKLNDARGQRVLERYWPTDDLVIARPNSPSELKKVAHQVVFSETHGYRWLSKPPVAPPEPWEIVDAFKAMNQTEKPNEDDPAIFSARLVGGYNAKALAYDQKLGLMTLVVRADVLEDWHVTVDGGDIGVRPVEIKAELPDGLAWHTPKFAVSGKTISKNGIVEGHGILFWKRDIWIRGGAGTYTETGKVRFNVCNEIRCRKAVELPFETRVKVR